MNQTKAGEAQTAAAVVSKPWMAEAPSQKQINFIVSLAEQRVANDEERIAIVSATQNGLNSEGKPLTKGDASNMITLLQRLQPLPQEKQAKPSTTTRAPRKEITEGMYKCEGDFYKVQVAVYGSGNLYGKRLQLVWGNKYDEPLTKDELADAELIAEGKAAKTIKGKFLKETGIVSKLASNPTTEKLQLDEAKLFGQLYGVCCACGRLLTDENSIAAGIGPICAGRF